MEIPFIFFGLSNNTLGILSYSAFASLILLMKERSRISLSEFEKFLAIFSLLCLILYLPLLKSHGRA